jgi:hypothetical protein
MTVLPTWAGAAEWGDVTGTLVRFGIDRKRNVALGRLALTFDERHRHDLPWIMRLRGRITELADGTPAGPDEHTVREALRRDWDTDGGLIARLPFSFAGVETYLWDVEVPLRHLPDGPDTEPHRDNALLPCRADLRNKSKVAALPYARALRDRRQGQFLQALEEHGVRIPAALVQANNELWGPGKRTLPAQVLITFDPDVRHRDALLSTLALRAARLKEKERPRNRDEQLVHDTIWDGEKVGVYHRRVRLGPGFTGGPIVYLADLWMYRPYLPRDGVKSHGLFPVLAEPGDEGGIELLSPRDAGDEKPAGVLAAVPEVLDAEPVEARVAPPRGRVRVSWLALAVVLLVVAGGGVVAWGAWQGRWPWAAGTGVEPAGAREIRVADTYVWGVAFSPDGKRLLTADGLRGPGRARLWDAATGKPLADVYPHDTEVFGAAFQPGGPLVALAGSGRGLCLLDPDRPADARTLPHPSYVRGVAFSPDGQRVASQCEQLVQAWDAASGQHLWQANVRPELSRWRGAVHLAFAPDGATVAAPDGGSGVALLDARDGHSVATLAGHQDVVVCVAYSPDGQTLASGGMDNAVRLWGAKDRREQRVLTDAPDWVHGLAFSPDGTKLAAACRGKGGVLLWDVPAGRLLATLPAQEVMAVAFSPDGRTLAAAGGDGVVRLWAVPR